MGPLYRHRVNCVGLCLDRRCRRRRRTIYSRKSHERREKKDEKSQRLPDDGHQHQRQRILSQRQTGRTEMARDNHLYLVITTMRSLAAAAAAAAQHTHTNHNRMCHIICIHRVERQSKRHHVRVQTHKRALSAISSVRYGADPRREPVACGSHKTVKIALCASSV